MATYLITGAGGFIGRAVVARFGTLPGVKLRLLVRSPAACEDFVKQGFEVVVGDVCNPDSYRHALEGVDAVLHLAAATGRVSRRELVRNNITATQILLEACRGASVKRFVYFSTIAARYPNKRYYAYADTKYAAEELVRDSGIPCAILRPTVVLGVGSSTWNTLCRLVSLPIVPMLQGRAAVLMQPIDVDDVVRAVEVLLKADRFDGETFELGGPDILSIADFFTEVARARDGGVAKFLRFPLAPVRLALALAEPSLRRFLPATAGQLALFANDSTAAPNWLGDQLKPAMPPLTITLARISSNLCVISENLVATPSPLSDRAQHLANRECEIFTRLLLGVAPDELVRRHYSAAIRITGLSDDASIAPFDRATLKLGRSAVFFARIADAYSALLHRKGVLRRKLLLLAAILEHTPQWADRFDSARADKLPLVRLGLTGMRALVFALIGLLLLTPMRLVNSLRAPL